MSLPDFTTSASIENGQATFFRSGSQVEIDVEVHLPGAHANLFGGDIESAVFDCRIQEINALRRSYGELTSALTAHLDEVGKEARIDDSARWSEERDWSLTPEAITIAPTRHEIRSRISIPPSASDASVAREALRKQLQTRIEAIEAVYRQVAVDTMRRFPTPTGVNTNLA